MNEPGLDFDSQAIMTGLDYRVLDNLVPGAAVSYTRIDSDPDAGDGAVAVDDYSVSLLGTYFEHASFYLEVYGVYDPQAANVSLRAGAGSQATANAIVGWVSVPAGISSVTVNGRDIAVNDHCAFRMDIVFDDPSRPIEIVATGNLGQKANVDFHASLSDFERDMATYAQQRLTQPW